LKDNFFNTIYSLIVIFLGWFILSIVLESAVVPAPPAVFKVLADNLLSEIIPHLSMSLYRITAAVISSLLIGVTIGIISGMHKNIDRFLAPLIYLLYPIPKIAFLPVFMLLFGLGDLSKIILVFVIVIFQIIVTTRDGVKNIDSKYFASARSLGMNRFDIYKHLVFPAVLPGILTALRITIGTSIAVLFFAENFAVRLGIGYYIMNSWAMVNYLKMYSGIIAVSFLGLALFKLIDILEKKYCSWN